MGAIKDIVQGKKDGEKKKIPGHMLAFRINDEEEKILDGICKRSGMSRPKVAKALIRIADGKTLKQATELKSE